MEPVQLAAILGAAVLLASMFSVELGISVALLELAFGVLLGNIFSLDANASWLSFIAGFASVVLTFLAGAEVDPDYFRERLKASLAIGIVSFAGPFVAATLIALGPLGWSNKASLIAGTALSTTSLAVVYAVLVETGLNEHRAHVRHDQRAVRPQRTHHRPHPVLAVGHDRGALGDRPDRGRTALVRAAGPRRAAASPGAAGALGAPDRGVELELASSTSAGRYRHTGQMNAAAPARRAVICEPLRTPVGRFGGVLRDVPATALAATVIAAVIDRTGISGKSPRK